MKRRVLIKSLAAMPLETLGPGDPYVKVPALVDKARRAGLFAI